MLLTWSDLRDFVAYLDTDSALWQATNPEWRGWGNRLHTEMILADLYDLLNALRTQHASANSKRRQKPPKPYPRPNAKNDVMGAEPVPKGTFMDWWENSIEGVKDGIQGDI